MRKITLLFLALLLIGCQSTSKTPPLSESPLLDGSTPPQESAPLREVRPEIPVEKVTDLDPISQIPCRELLKEWSKFVRKNKQCHKDEDCIIVGRLGNSSCAYGPGGGLGDAVNRSAKKEAQKYIIRFNSKECRGLHGCLYDSPDPKLEGCVNGVCKRKSDAIPCPPDQPLSQCYGSKEKP